MIFKGVEANNLFVGLSFRYESFVANVPPIPKLIQLWQITSGRLQSIEARIIPITDLYIKPLGFSHNVYSIREACGL